MRLLMIEDSPTIVTFVKIALRDRSDIEFLPTCSDGMSGVKAAIEQKPDVILMDLQLPELHGLDAIRQIMTVRPCPIVVLSAHVGAGNSGMAFDALRAGAVEVMGKPEGLSTDQVDRFRKRLLQLIDSVTVLQVKPTVSLSSSKPSSTDQELNDRSIVLMGSSTGGLPVLHEILSAIPYPYPLPIVIAHHIMAGFDAGLQSWLSRTGHQVQIAQSGDAPQKGIVSMIPAGFDASLENFVFHLTPSTGATPSPCIDMLFQSSAESYGGSTLAFLFSGMGEDGAKGLLALKKTGALTLVQKPETCVVAGMPEAALRQNAADRTLSPPACASLLLALAKGMPGSL